MQMYRAAPLSRADIRRFALALRKKLGLEDCLCIPVVEIVENVLPELFKDYTFIVEECEVMGDMHGLTNPETMTIKIRQDVYDRACQGMGRDRSTIAHELAHLLMHNGVALGLARVEPGIKIPPYCDPEWQASAFAGEFLMAQHLIKTMEAEDIMEKCLVSYQAAAYQKRYAK